MRLTLSTRNAGGLAANFVAADKRAQAAVKKVVQRNGIALHAKAYAACPVETGFMRSQLQLKFSEGGYVYQVGWDEADWIAAGAFTPSENPSEHLSHQPYFLYVIFGTRTQPANDFFFPLRDRQNEIFRQELRAELRAAIRRRRAG